MKCKADKSILSGTISCPPNKSYSHRAIFLAALANGKSVLRNVLLSRDTLATVNACKAFGAKIEIDGSTVTVESTGEIIPQTSQIDASNSGTTIRISTAIASLSNKTITLTGDASLQKRPMQPLLDALTQLGVECMSTDGKPPVTIKGRSEGGNTHISGSISSQFISALLISGTRMKNGITLEIDGELVSKPYLDSTIATMKKFGVTVNTISPYKKYNIPSQKYTPADFVVPSDFSSMALLLSAAVLLGEDMSINASLGDLPQGDREILSYLERLGVKINLGEKITLVSPKLLNGGRFDLSNNPDLLPPMAILALKTSKPIEIYNVKHARFKETDRIAILAKELAKIGIIVTEKEDGLILDSPKALKSAELESLDDHRLFMAFSIAGMFVGNCTITDPDSVDVSYPTFVEDMRKIGANLTI
ncbi:3-phosphoshikimate 1-carboxyvinyltransferase [Candidatus Nitrosotalea okcheonensis]|uniref:3-phosphoshikimate 1-carboxyvinyltransferase n=1 Tax=Candidatus Nitrosotalea okcheonensis TaxID=1903276 RepID=A0A2H1FC25_9ARCH|nr:3-phosphoshikimate 1-carboxyvinyltransferase [Candidatus Nitrosotalea okcheonensis]SMH70320.1 putative 3-phosphoshikimate 1-carboxyvinyltransferase [Candidatus Nitrosotalea okcheonensis]